MSAPQPPSAAQPPSAPQAAPAEQPARAAAQLVACPDGPFLLRGDVDIVAPDGRLLPRRRRTVALCRCGASSIKPLCDGTHKRIGFKATARVAE